MEESSMTDLAERPAAHLRRLMGDTSVRGLADATGLGRTVIRGVLDGRQTATVNLEILADHFGVPHNIWWEPLP